MLVFDDLHWTDEMSLEVIGELARHAADRPLLLIGDYRADEFPADTIHREWRARLLSQRHAEEVRLRPLTLEETGVATTLILGGELPAPRDVVEAVHERTNGIPLHIEELLAALDDDARTDGRRIREAHVPDTIGDAVLARLGRLSDDARTRRAGGRGRRPLLQPRRHRRRGRSAARPSSSRSIQELVDAAILYPFDYVDQGYYDFRHQLLRDAIYGTVPPSQLRRFHAQAAEFVMGLEGVEHRPRLTPLRAGRPAAAGVPGVDDGGRKPAGSPPGRRRTSSTERAIANMPPDLPIGEQAELYERFADAAARSSATRSASRRRRGPASSISRRAGRSMRRGC